MRSLVLVAVLLAGCFPDNRGARPPGASDGQASLSADSPVFLAGTSWMVIPLIYPAGEYDGVQGGWASSGGPQQRTQNYVLHDVASGRTSLVFDRPADDLELFVLEHGQPPPSEDERPNPARKAVGLLIRAEDQEALSGEANATPQRVYFASPGVDAIVPLTPEKTRLVWWAFDWERDVVCVAFRRDSNGDGVFRTNDAIEVVRYEVATGKLAPLVDAALIERVVKLASPPPAK